MAVARAFTSLILARQAASYLVNNGIPATILGEQDAFGGGGAYGSGGQYTVVVEDAYKDAAKDMLNHMDQIPVEKDPDWESQIRPDLSMLDAATTAPCPSCSEDLPLDASVTKCPRCAAPVDVVEVLVARHGPEVLDACFPDLQEDIPADVLDASLIDCPGCGYSLTGLAHRGQCPECGADYSKQDILRRRSGLL